MNESIDSRVSPWRALQQLLASQFGALSAGEPGLLKSRDTGAAHASSWIMRARQRQANTDGAPMGGAPVG